MMLRTSSLCGSHRTSAPHTFPKPSPVLARRSRDSQKPRASESGDSLAEQDLRALFKKGVPHPVSTPVYVKGQVPPGLDGAFVWNGPARWDVNGNRMRHVFDGDGMVHSLRLAAGEATFCSKYVDTPGKRLEDQAGEPLLSGFGTGAKYGALGQLAFGRRNPASTHIVYHHETLWALCESGWPHRLDAQNLATLGGDDLGGLLRPGSRFSAHPKWHPRTGDLWNFETDYAKRALHVYRCPQQGQPERAFSVPMPFPSLIHDFCLTDTQAVFIFPPLALPALPVGVITGLRGVGEAMAWKPELGSHITVADLKSGQCRSTKTDPFFMFHTANGYDENGGVVVDASTYPDAGVMRLFEDALLTKVSAHSRVGLERITISAWGDVTRQALMGAQIEFPRVMPQSLTKAHDHVWGTSYVDSPLITGVPTHVDLIRGLVSQAPWEPGEFAGEGVPVTTADGGTWLLNVVRDTRKQLGEVRVYHAYDLAAGPVCRVGLPSMGAYQLSWQLAACRRVECGELVAGGLSVRRNLRSISCDTWCSSRSECCCRARLIKRSLHGFAALHLSEHDEGRKAPSRRRPDPST